jgi:hypothetical protein
MVFPQGFDSVWDIKLILTFFKSAFSVLMGNEGGTERHFCCPEHAAAYFFKTLMNLVVLRGVKMNLVVLRGVRGPEHC